MVIFNLTCVPEGWRRIQLQRRLAGLVFRQRRRVGRNKSPHAGVVQGAGLESIAGAVRG